MISSAPLARLERVSLRKAWPNEAANFTPWLAEKANLDLLGERIGLPLQLEAVERKLGLSTRIFYAKNLTQVIGY